MNTIKNRLDIFLASLKISGQEFERKINASSGWFCRVNDSLSSTKKEAIARTFPNLNMNWLLLGEGEMLNNQNNINITKNSGGNNAIGNDNQIGILDIDLIKTQAQTIAQQQETITKLTDVILNLSKK